LISSTFLCLILFIGLHILFNHGIKSIKSDGFPIGALGVFVIEVSIVLILLSGIGVYNTIKLVLNIRKMKDYLLNLAGVVISIPYPFVSIYLLYRLI